MTAPVIDPRSIELRPGARWTRILMILREGAYTPSEIMRQSVQSGIAWRVERKKISQALARMAGHGLVENAGPWGWTATADGRDAAERFAVTERATMRDRPEANGDLLRASEGPHV